MLLVFAKNPTEGQKNTMYSTNIYQKQVHNWFKEKL